jgi:preprotein translocase subunit SecA
MHVIANLKKAIENNGKEVSLAIEKNITLAIIDNAWKEHLREMDDLKQSVQNASYEQKDPLVIYKLEAFDLFKQMVQKINKDIVSFLIKSNLPFQETSNVQEAKSPKKTDMSKLRTGRDTSMERRHQPQYIQPSQQQVTQPIKVEKKIGRNELCPCGSGKKYKQCHGRET